MSWEKLSKVVGKAAPLLGSALGPGGAAIGAIIAEKLGVENNPSAIETAIQSNPESAAKLIEIQNAHKENLEALALETAKEELKDKQSARKEHKGHWMPAAICIALTFMVSGVIYALFNGAIPEENKELAYVILGGLITKWGDSIAYWVGTTRSSSDKSKQIEGLVER